MWIDSLTRLYSHDVSTLLAAEHRQVHALRDLSQRADAPALRSLLLQHAEATQFQGDRLGDLLAALPIHFAVEPCAAMRELVATTMRTVLVSDHGPVADAAILGAMSRIEHYEIAAYGGLIGLAGRIGRAGDGAILRELLEHEWRALEGLVALWGLVIPVQGPEHNGHAPALIGAIIDESYAPERPGADAAHGPRPQRSRALRREPLSRSATDDPRR